MITLNLITQIDKIAAIKFHHNLISVERNVNKA